MVGIDLHGEKDAQALLLRATASGAASPSSPASAAYTPSFPGRVLQSLTPACDNDSSILKGCEPLAIEAPPAGRANDESKALIAVDTSAEHKALVVQGDESEKKGEETRAGAAYDPVVQYRTVGNDTQSAAVSKGTYLLCPEALSIQPSLVGEVRVKRERGEDGQASASAKRLRRTLGLPSPASPSALTTTASPPPSKLALAANDQLLLWVPSSEVDVASSTNASDRTAGRADLVQISCQISSIDPVYRA